MGRNEVAGDPPRTPLMGTRRPLPYRVFCLSWGKPALAAHFSTDPSA